jgi:hypothetical protein
MKHEPWPIKGTLEKLEITPKKREKSSQVEIPKSFFNVRKRR